MVMALQTIVSREVDPAHPSVVTAGEFHAGTAPNVLASSTVLRGTIRAQEESVRQHLKTSIRRIADSIAQLHDTKVTVEIHEGTPAVINSKKSFICPTGRQGRWEKNARCKCARPTWEVKTSASICRNPRLLCTVRFCCSRERRVPGPFQSI